MDSLKGYDVVRNDLILVVHEILVSVGRCGDAGVKWVESLLGSHLARLLPARIGVRQL